MLTQDEPLTVSDAVWFPARRSFRCLRFQLAMDTTDITAHIFRHNFATILYNAGVDVKTAQAIMGQSSITVMMDIYTHLSQQNKAEATDKLNVYLE